MNESISRAAGASHGAGLPPEQMEPRSVPPADPAPANDALRDPDPERTRASFGAAPLSDPVNPRVNDRGLRRPPRLVRPGLAISGGRRDR